MADKAREGSGGAGAVPAGPVPDGDGHCGDCGFLVTTGSGTSVQARCGYLGCELDFYDYWLAYCADADGRPLLRPVDERDTERLNDAVAAWQAGAGAGLQLHEWLGWSPERCAAWLASR